MISDADFAAAVARSDEVRHVNDAARGLGPAATGPAPAPIAATVTGAGTDAPPRVAALPVDGPEPDRPGRMGHVPESEPAAPVPAVDPAPVPDPLIERNPHKAAAARVAADAGEPLRRMPQLADVNGTIVEVDVDPYGRLAYMSKAAQDASRPVILAPAGPVTPFGILLAQGWTGADDLDDLREIIGRIEALHAGMVALKATVAGTHRGSQEDIGDAIRKADPLAFVAAVVSVSVGAWMDQNVGQQGTVLHLWHHALIERLHELVHRHQSALLASLEGLDSPAATSARELVSAMRSMTTAPKPGTFGTIVR